MDAAFEITQEMVGDLVYQNGGLKTDSGLRTAILISLFQMRGKKTSVAGGAEKSVQSFGRFKMPNVRQKR